VKLLLAVILSFLSQYCIASVDESRYLELRSQIYQTPELALNEIERVIEEGGHSNEMKIKLQFLLAEGYNQLGDKKKAIIIAKNVKDKAHEFGFKLLEAKGYRRLAFFQGNDTQLSLESALLYVDKGYEIINSIDNQKEKAEALLHLGSVLIHLDQHIQALEYFYKSLKISRDTGEHDLHSSIHGNIAMIHTKIGDYHSAIKYNEYWLELTGVTEVTKFKINSNLGTLYHLLKDSNSALKYFELAMKYNGDEDVSWRMISNIATIGTIKLDLGKTEEALDTFNKGLAIVKKSARRKEFESSYGYSLLVFGKARSLHPSIESLKLANKALQLSTTLEIKWSMRKVNKFLADAYSENKNDTAASKHNKLYLALNDEISKKEIHVKLQNQNQRPELEKYFDAIDSERKSHKIGMMRKDKELQNFITVFSILGSVLFFITLFIFYRRYFHKKQAEQLRIQVKEQTNQIRALGDIGRKITSNLDLNIITKLVYKHANELFGVDRFAIGIYNFDNQQIKIDFPIENKCPLKPYIISMTDTDNLAVQCINDNSEIIDGNKPLGKSLEDLPQRSIMHIVMGASAYFPLLIESTIIGCIHIQRSSGDGFSAAHLSMMRTIVSYTSIAIDNALTHKALKQASHSDYLTQLPNRRAFIETAEYQLEVCKRNETPLCFAIADIDKFKLFNDNYGHDGGDFVLKQVSKLFQEHIREQDLVARWGGEEFVFMFPNTDLTGAINILEKLRMELEDAHYEFNDQSLNVTSTFGVTKVEDNFNLDYIIDIADSALYEGKESGRNKVVPKLNKIMSFKDISERN